RFRTDLVVLSVAGTAMVVWRIPRVAFRVSRFVRVVHRWHDDAERTNVSRFLAARLERIWHADHRRRSNLGTRRDHSTDFVPRHRAVLHLEPDEVEMLADLAVQLGIKT